jgi:hypothetical protein
MDEFICNDNFEDLAGQYYNNVVFESDEFLEDLGRIKYVKRLLNKYHQTGELKERLIINHLVILYNVFDSAVLTKMLFFKFEHYHHYLKPFLIFMNRLPDQIDYYTKKIPVLYTSDISSDPIIEQELRKHLRPS